MKVDHRLWRSAAGAAVLTVFALLASQLAPLYFRNLELQRFLEESVQDLGVAGRPDELLVTAIVNKASQLGLPVKSSQVKLKRAPGRIRIEILYIVPVDFWIYTVDLHFHPGAGRL